MTIVKLDTPAQYLKGVGPKVAKLLGTLAVETVEDLVYFFPREYQDRTNVKPIAQLSASNSEIVKGRIASISHQITRNRFSVLKLELSDLTGTIQAVWFNQPYLTKLFRRGMKLIIFGKVEYSSFDKTLQVSVRDFEVDTGENVRIAPLYPLTEGLYPKKLKSIIKSALDNYLPVIKDALPDDLRKKYKLCGVQEAIQALHFPADLSKVEPARHRLAFEEFFFFQLNLALRQSAVKAKAGIAFNVEQKILDGFIGSLPFKLTSAQNRVMTEIVSDMRAARPMNRLLQGDVGSGKTIIAALAAFLAIRNGYQVALMAPTEILAKQHFDKVIQLSGYRDIRVKLLTGSTQKIKEVRVMDKYDLVIGTQALIQRKIEFKKLGLVIVDEQHRFGVKERAVLAEKGLTPDNLVMTATPIPRSLGLTLYGELDRSVLDELPPGRTPIKTHYVPENKRQSSYEFMRQKINEGRQVFLVCPLVEESEKIDLKAAMDEADRLQREIFPEFKVGLMHGKLKSDQKDNIMKQFRAGKIQILVSTTVIEVGIDIPNATIMVVEHAERFGLAQLHQLRGRIGRGSEQSYCFLIAETKSSPARARIKAMLESSDGFHIAEVDLRLRGPGDFFGTRQSGLPIFRVADIIKDEKILCQARVEAFELVAKDVNRARNLWHSQRQATKDAPSGASLN